MYNIYTALVLIYIMYIYSVTYTSEVIAGKKRPDPVSPRKREET